MIQAIKQAWKDYWTAYKEYAGMRLRGRGMYYF